MQAADMCNVHAEKVLSQCSLITKWARLPLLPWPWNLIHQPLTFPLLLKVSLLQVPCETGWGTHILRYGEGAAQVPWDQGLQSQVLESTPETQFLSVILATKPTPCRVYIIKWEKFLPIASFKCFRLGWQSCLVLGTNFFSLPLSRVSSKLALSDPWN